MKQTVGVVSGLQVRHGGRREGGPCMPAEEDLVGPVACRRKSVRHCPSGL